MVSTSKATKVFPVFGAAFLLGVAITSCDVSDKNLVGEYYRKGVIVDERLVIKSDHTYEHELTYTSGRHVVQTNTWERNRNLNCRDFYSSVDGATGEEVDPPKMYSLSNLEVKSELLIGIYEKGYFFQKKK
jgi:hypothetical protein